MSGPFLGGHAVTWASWEGPFALLVKFSTTYTDKCHQVYFGRSLVGYTENVDQRQIMCHCAPSEWPEHGPQMVAVEPEQRATDYGSLLPPRPYNAVKMSCTTVDWAPGTKYLEIVAGNAAGEAVDTDNVLANVLIDTDREYEFITLPLPGSGVWSFEAAGRGETRPDGNRGTPAALSVHVDAHPPDVDYTADDYNRLDAVATGGTLTVSFTEPA